MLPKGLPKMGRDCVSRRERVGPRHDSELEVREPIMELLETAESRDVGRRRCCQVDSNRKVVQVGPLWTNEGTSESRVIIQARSQPHGKVSRSRGLHDQ
jgi:hypothetical protein